jgi:hypothetical protein
MNGFVGLADVVVAVHLAYLIFIPLGGFLAWRWPRVVPFHLAAIMVGLVSVTIHFDCPLTTWEQHLRRDGGQHAYRDGFVDHYLAGRVYPHGYAWAVQTLFAVCIVASYVPLIVRYRRDRGATRTGISGAARHPA